MMKENPHKEPGPEMDGYYALLLAIKKRWTASQAIKWVKHGQWPTEKIDVDVDELIELRQQGLSIGEISRRTRIPKRIVKYKLKQEKGE